jgi:chemotaxis signal transduction protein
MESRKIMIFRIGERKFAIGIEKIKRIKKGKGADFKITEIEGAPPYIIGVSEVEITRGEKKLITLIDFKKLIEMKKIEIQEDEEINQTQEKNRFERKVLKAEDEEDTGKDKRKIFMIVSKDNNEFVGVLIDEPEDIRELDERNSKIYPPPKIKNVKDLFESIVILQNEKGEEEQRILLLNPDSIIEMAGL